LKRPTIAKKTAKFAFYGLVAGVTLLLGVSALKRHGDKLKKQGKRILGKTKRTLKETYDNGLSKRQKEILKLFDKSERISVDLLKEKFTGINERTLRRDMDTLKEKKYVRQVGKTRGSYYVER